MAPALTMGLAGRPVPGSRLIALNASPLGSTPTRASTPSTPTSASASAYTKGLEIDWMRERSPAVAGLVHRARDADERETERLGSAVDSCGM